MPRQEFTRKTKAKAFERCGGNCEGCDAKLKTGEVEYDHIREASNGGDNSLSNCQCLCKPCHKAKTKSGTQTMRRMERARDRQNNALKRTSKPLQSAGFPKNTKAPKIDKSAIPSLPRRSMFAQKDAR